MSIVFEITALQVMLDLQKKYSDTPINRGASYVVLMLLHSHCETMFDIVLDSYNETEINFESFWFKTFWPELLQHISAYCLPLTNILSRPDAHKLVMHALISIIMKDESFEYNSGLTTAQNHLAFFLQWNTGFCFHYVAVAIYNLLESGIRPIESIWVNEKNTKHGDGHNVVVIGLENPQDYKTLSTNKKALIFDAWSGEIYPAFNAFMDGKPLAAFDESSIQSYYRIDQNESNPLHVSNKDSLLYQYLDDLTTLVMEELDERHKENEQIMADGEFFKIYCKDPALREPLEDLNDEKRKNNFSSLSIKLENYNNAARTIQHSFFSRHPKVRPIAENTDTLNSTLQTTPG